MSEVSENQRLITKVKKVLTPCHSYLSILYMINYDIPNSISQFNPQPSMLDFNDLDFKPHRHADGVQAVLDLGNHFSISVVANNDEGKGLYGNVSDDLYEVAVFYKNDMAPLSPSDDVAGWQSPQQVSYIMAKIQSEGVYWLDELKESKKEYRKKLELDN